MGVVAKAIDSPFRSLYLILTSTLLLLLCLIIFPPAPDNVAPHPLFGAAFTTKGFHLVTPAPKAQLSTCRLLLSSSATGYPDPVLVGWDGHGLYNGTQSQLYRISEVLAYMRTLNKTSDDDLIMVADPSSTILQMPPEVLIHRYFRALRKARDGLKRLRVHRRHGADGVLIESSILFGASTQCGPFDRSKPLAICDSTAYKGESPTGSQSNYLSSSVFMGPVKDVRAFLNAVMDKIDDEFNDDFEDRHSDQHYMTLVWDDQQTARRALAKRGGQAHLEHGLVPKRLEYGVTIDHDGDVFITDDAHGSQISWSKPNEKRPTNSGDGKLHAALPAGIKGVSPPPLPPVPAPKEGEDGDHMSETWEDMMLGTNALTSDIFALYQTTTDEELWWSKLWFHPRAEDILKAARQKRLRAVFIAHASQQPAHVAIVDKVRYVLVRGSQGDEFQHMRSRDKANVYGGAWNDLGEYMSWDEMCKSHEPNLFLGEDDI